MRDVSDYKVEFGVASSLARYLDIIAIRDI